MKGRAALGESCGGGGGGGKGPTRNVATLVVSDKLSPMEETGDQAGGEGGAAAGAAGG